VERRHFLATSTKTVDLTLIQKTRLRTVNLINLIRGVPKLIKSTELGELGSEPPCGLPQMISVLATMTTLSPMMRRVTVEGQQCPNGQLLHSQDSIPLCFVALLTALLITILLTLFEGGQSSIYSFDHASVWPVYPLSSPSPPRGS
jgi:hypothetical protein